MLSPKELLDFGIDASKKALSAAADSLKKIGSSVFNTRTAVAAATAGVAFLAGDNIASGQPSGPAPLEPPAAGLLLMKPKDDPGTFVKFDLDGVRGDALVGRPPIEQKRETFDDTRNPRE